MREMIRGIEAREFDIIIGTQIVAKGHNFPGPCPRRRRRRRSRPCAWRRPARRGTHVPALASGHGPRRAHEFRRPRLRANLFARSSGDEAQSSPATARRFSITRSRRGRRDCCRLTAGSLQSLCSARDKALTEATARDISRRAPASETISVLGPTEAPIAVVRGRHRWRLLVKAPRDADLQGYLRDWAGMIPKLKTDIRITVDVDPYNFL